MKQPRPFFAILHLLVLIVLAVCLAIDAFLLFSGCATVPSTQLEDDRKFCWSVSKVQSQYRETALGRINDPASERRVFETCMAQRGQ